MKYIVKGQLQEESAFYNENSTVNFGMHAGKLWSEVPTSFLELQVKKNTIYKSLCIKLLKSRKSEFKI